MPIVSLDRTASRRRGADRRVKLQLENRGHPGYWTIEGKPYFSIYELYRLVDGLGGPDATRAALERFRAKCISAGFAGLHLNGVTWGVQILPGEQKIKNIRELVTFLGLEQRHFLRVDTSRKVARLSRNSLHVCSGPDAEILVTNRPGSGPPLLPQCDHGLGTPVLGTCQSDAFINRSYPFMPTLSGNTPGAFEAALRAARSYLDRTPSARRILTLNAWNEWTEGSYLEPDTVNGMAYLEAIKKVFAS